nr:MAG TPA: hypothetical protein [Caudoviricetes sp.]
MAKEYKTLAGVEPEDAADVSIRLKVLAGELYTVLCAAESLTGGRGARGRGGRFDPSEGTGGRVVYGAVRGGITEAELLSADGGGRGA